MGFFTGTYTRYAKMKHNTMNAKTYFLQALRKPSINMIFSKNKIAKFFNMNKIS